MNENDQNAGFSDDELNPEADKGREPEFVQGRMGTRMYSVAALIERITQAFLLEHGDIATLMLDTKSKSEHLKQLRDVVDYVLSVESIQLAPEERAELIRKAYAELFGYGPLDQFFADENITTISVKGLDQIAVRYGHDELVVTEALFDTPEQLTAIIRRLFVQADVHPDDEQPYIEFGLSVDDRHVCISMMRPPISIETMLDIRVHPKTLPSLNSFRVDETSKQLLEALMKSQHGVLIVGEPESGKTMFLSSLLALGELQDVATVERAGELFVSDETKRFIVRWSSDLTTDDSVSFGEQIATVSRGEYPVMVLDELRNDEPEALAPLLDSDTVERVIASMRGPIDQRRLMPALSMLARRSDMHRGEEMVHRFYKRFPFIVTIRRTREASLQITSIAEMQLDSTGEYFEYVELMEHTGEALQLTGKRPHLDLVLPESFWQNS